MPLSGIARDAGEKENNGIISRLEDSTRKAHLANDKLSKQLFVLSNRIINVVERIGFTSFDDFEEAVLDEPDVWKVDSVKANHAHAESSRKPQPRTDSHSRYKSSVPEALREEFEQLKHQVTLLQQSARRTPKTKRPSFPIRSPLSPLKSSDNSTCPERSKLRAQLKVLSRKYDALVATKESAEKKYKEDYQKWRDFKVWLSSRSKHAKVLRDQLAGNPEFEFELPDFVDEADCGRDMTSGQTRFPIPRSKKDENKCSSRSPSRSPSRATETKTRSEGGLSMLNPQMPTFERVPAKASTFLSDSPSFMFRRIYTHSELPNTAVPEEAPPGIPSLRATVNAKSQYADMANAERSINALYEIDVARNNGLPFQFDEVVRSREHRQTLQAGDCDCCKEYYDCLAPIPGRSAPPRWFSSPIPDTSDVTDHEAPQSHKKQISRHRHQWSPTKTPPDYWNIGFPTTQEVAEINRRAAEMHANKRRRVEKEASTVGGRYIKRRDKEEVST